MIRSISIITILSWSILAQGQDMSRVKQIVNELSSPEYFGRGYTNKGDSLAADYIANQLKRLGINPIEKAYFQHFEMDINTYTGHPSLKIAGKDLQVSRDWVPYPSSPSIHGTFPVLWISKKDLTHKKAFQQLCKQDFANSFITLDSCVKNNEALYYLARNLFTSGPFKCKGMVDAVDAPKYSARRYVNDYVLLRVRKELWNRDIHSIEIDLENDFKQGYTSQNVMGYIPGKTDTCITLIGHYDHLGMLGNAIYAGANDNASGVAMMLELGRYFKEHKPHYSILLLFFAAEEAGFFGSTYYTNHPVFPLEKTKMAINFEMVASGTQWTELIQAQLYPSIEKNFVTINNHKHYIASLKPTGYEASSDHINFHDKGIPAIFFWTEGGNEYYHEPGDLPETLSYTSFEGIFKLVRDFIEIHR